MSLEGGIAREYLILYSLESSLLSDFLGWYFLCDPAQQIFHVFYFEIFANFFNLSLYLQRIFVFCP